MSEILGDWKRFVNSNFKFEFFSEALYQHLIVWCSFIAHYNREQFYNFYFSINNIDNTFRFVKQFTIGVSAELGMKYWVEKNSVNQEMMDYMIENLERVERHLNSLRVVRLSSELSNVLDRISLVVNDGFVLLDNKVLLNKGYENHILVPIEIMRMAHTIVKHYYDAEYHHYIESVSNDADDVENNKNHIWNDISALGIWIAQNNIPYEVNNA